MSSDISVTAAAVIAVIGAGYAIARVARSFWAGFKVAVQEATAELHDDVRELRTESDARHAENVRRFDSVDERLETVETDLKTHMRDVADDRERNQGDHPA